MSSSVDSLAAHSRQLARRDMWEWLRQRVLPLVAVAICAIAAGVIIGLSLTMGMV